MSIVRLNYLNRLYINYKFSVIEDYFLFNIIIKILMKFDNWDNENKKIYY
jgi:hypothetical protein